MFYKNLFAYCSVSAFLHCIFKNVLVISQYSLVVDTNIYWNQVLLCIIVVMNSCY
jgi:hypothetical protein